MTKGVIAVFIIANSAATAVAMLVAFVELLTGQWYPLMLSVPYVMINLVLLVVVLGGLLIKWAES